MATKIVLNVDTHKNYLEPEQAAKEVVLKALEEYKTNHGARALWPITDFEVEGFALKTVEPEPEKPAVTVVSPGQKFDNDKTIKDHALEVLRKEVAGSFITRKTSEVAELVKENGYKTTSAGFANTVRLNLEILEREGLVHFDEEAKGWRAARIRQRRTA